MRAWPLHAQGGGRGSAPAPVGDGVRVAIAENVAHARARDDVQRAALRVGKGEDVMEMGAKKEAEKRATEKTRRLAAAAAVSATHHTARCGRTFPGSRHPSRPWPRRTTRAPRSSCGPLQRDRLPLWASCGWDGKECAEREGKRRKRRQWTAIRTRRERPPAPLHTHSTGSVFLSPGLRTPDFQLKSNVQSKVPTDGVSWWRGRRQQGQATRCVHVMPPPAWHAPPGSSWCSPWCGH